MDANRMYQALAFLANINWPVLRDYRRSTMTAHGNDVCCDDMHRRSASVIDRCAFWGCIVLLCAGFIVPGLGQVGTMILLMQR